MGFLIADEGTVGFDDDVVLLAVGDDGALLAEWVQLVRGQPTPARYLTAS